MSSGKQDLLCLLLQEIRVELAQERFAKEFSAVTAIVALLAWGLVLAGVWQETLWVLLPALLLSAGWFLTWLRMRFWRPTDLELARRIEERHPELDARLLTVLEDEQRGAGGDFFQQRLMTEVMSHQREHPWRERLGQPGLKRWTRVLVILSVLAVGGQVFLVKDRILPQEAVLVEVAEQEEEERPEERSAETEWTFEVEPGEVEIERGTRLLVEVRIQPEPDEAPELRWETSEAESMQTLVMRRGVEGDRFGAMLERVDEDLEYHVGLGDQTSDSYQVTVFDYPKLLRVDATVTPPEGLGQEAKVLEKTMRVRARVGSSVELAVQVNKPLAEAELFADEEHLVPLQADESDPTLLRGRFIVDASRKYRVHLVDEASRANRKPPWFEVKAVVNQLPKVEVVFPKRDLQVSPIQEFPLEARVSDDVSVLRSGLSFSIDGRVEAIDFDVPASQPGEKVELATELRLEDYGAEPRQWISYHFWAEDRGDGGEVRRSMSDLFFAQVREFESIFREAEPSPPSQGEPGQQSAQLMQLQKEVVNATWKVVRDVQAGQELEKRLPDVGVIEESQSMALDQTKEAMENAEDPQMKEYLTAAWTAMRNAIDALDHTREFVQRAGLMQALEFEQEALQWLHKASDREFQVSRQNAQSSSSGNPQEWEEQLMELELKQEEQRYQQEQQAMAESPQQQQELAVLNRLKELAKRQEALAKKLQDLRQQLDAAESEEERQALEQELKRLQQEQEELLADVDELQGELDEAEEASGESMAQAQEKLESAREQARQSAEDLEQEELASAANAAARASEQFGELEEEFRERTSGRFSEQLEALKAQAAEAKEAQQEIGQALEDQRRPEGEAGEMSSQLEAMTDGAAVSRMLAEQRERVEGLLESMQQLSEEAEAGEALLSRRLYEAVREAQTSGLEPRLREAELQSRYGRRAQAQEAERQAAQAVDQLEEDLSRAASSVLGSEADALRMARGELESLIEDVERELQANRGEREEAGGSASEPSAEEMAGRGNSEESPQDEAREPFGSGAGDENRSESAEMAQASGEARGESEEGEPTDSESGSGSPSEPGSSSAMAQGGNPQPSDSGEGGSPGEPSEPGRGPQASEGQSGSQGSPSGMAQSDSPGTPGESPSSESSSSAQGSPSGSSQAGSDRNAQAAGGGHSAGGGWFFDNPSTEVAQDTPFTGEGYGEWSDRLRIVEEVLQDPELANQAAQILDEARSTRVDSRRNNQPPQQAHLQNRIINPLVELRDRVLEELARLKGDDPTVPMDRDPVPAAYRDLVERYYRELGKGE